MVEVRERARGSVKEHRQREQGRQLGEAGEGLAPLARFRVVIIMSISSGWECDIVSFTSRPRSQDIGR